MYKSFSKYDLAGTLLLLALVLFGSPWLFGFSGDFGPSLSACAFATAFLLLFYAALVDIRDWAARGALGVGAWAMAAPFFFNFYHNEVALWTHVAVGALAVLVGAGFSDLVNRRSAQST